LYSLNELRDGPEVAPAVARLRNRGPLLHVEPGFRVIIVVMERSQSKRHLGARGFSLIELLIVISIILVILAVAVPKLNTAKENANEMVVIREIQTIHQAQTQYQSQFGKYATTLNELGPPTSGGPGPQAADLIPSSLATGEKDGYVFTLTATPQGYTVTANPKVYNSTGRRTFFSDQSMTIHQNWSAEAANASSPEFGGK
jgi:type IV pilus assembly protein PilA